MKKITLSLALLLILLIGITLQCIAQKKYEIHVSAGLFDRSDTVVSFYFPDSVEPGVYQLESSSGNNPVLQVDDSNKGWFILDELSMGESRVYEFSADPIESNNHMSNQMDSTQITFLSEGQMVLSYYHGDNNPTELDERYKRGGYIHPVYSPNGVVLTAHLNPMHPHQSGIWSAWTKTEFEGRNPDFWNIHNNTGRVDQADRLEKSWEGPVHTGFHARHFFKDLSAPEPLIAVNEEWKVYVYKSAKDHSYQIFDLVVTQSVNSGKPLILPEYHYGGVGFRGNREWDNPENMTFLTSDGLGREGNETRPKWTHIGGLVGRELAGMTVMDHPKNFRYPQPVRIHPEEPYFVYAPTQLGEMRIEPGSPYTARYRYVTYDGEPNPEELDRLWNDYAYPPGVTVKEK
ncbi:MAG: PmoA family protein [Balneolaceae bacterium]|nr:PmoA family protein [Balneolaceae bacterium]